ncbi:right-handed parallel beta-helix repeat-containing protein [Agreia sp. VKM Ac-1783]|uniref:right-handed parallel beta-helix repeat-containing protein n=1 Tax=Agreia sp. VKM Ac-1783 TaxID=1938889 RepID=UPI000A2AA981|nr:right-handed parallel beta-helix repeat-containing protein [Agreia sp. VKM Ac-1783]SMQ62127.1 hypothetical protein SAMN06295943_0720 [Agreia sp. VKM Ac-1783]
MTIGSLRGAALTVIGVLATSLAVASPASASTNTIYASPDGSGDACSSAQPCALPTAKDTVRNLVAASGTDITVELADGVYRVGDPLEFRAEDAGGTDGSVRWAAAAGAHPIISGAQPVTNWRVHDADAGIWVADTPQGVDTRQLYVNGVFAQRASRQIPGADIAMDASGITLTNENLAFLNDVPQQDRIDFEAKGDFTYRYSPVESIAGNKVTMKQPAWDNNTWGWDTPQYALLGGSTYWLSNSLSFLDEMNEWYVDPSAGQLYYKPGAGVDPNGLDVELPRVEALMSIGGTYDKPLENLTFEGITFTGTSWLGPNEDGYATQQNGSFMKGTYDYRPAVAFTSCSRGCEQFERARTGWYQQPAAVQVSAASNVRFEGNFFTNLGSSALGVGNDENATISGVGLGVSNIDVIGNRFAEVGGHGVFVGGNRADAHHPSDPRMLNHDVTVEDNTVSRAAVEYKDNSGILSTYVTNAHIQNNEVANVAYDGIDTGYGWGMNDAGGSGEYTKRGYYNWNTRYETPTTLKDNVVAGNLVHNTKSQFADGGSIYNLSASPGSVTEKNYLYNVSGVGLYLDEGTRSTTYRQNVLQGTNPWLFTNAYNATNTSDNQITQNWYNSGGAQIPNAEANRNVIVDNEQVSGTNWPTAAHEVICAAGVDPERRTALNGNLFSENPDCGSSGEPVAAPYSTSGSSAQDSFFAQSGEQFAIRATGTDVWGGGGQRDDQYGAIYQADAITAASNVSARIDTVGDANGWAKSGVMMRNDMAAPGASAGYAVVAVTPRNGVVFHWDADGDGYLDNSSTASVNTFRPIWVKLERLGDAVSAFYSYDGANYAQVGTAVTLTGAEAVEDAGIFSTSHDAAQSAINVFSDLTVETDTVKPEVTLVSPTSAGPFGTLAVQVDATDDRGLAQIVANVYKDGTLVKSTQSAIAGDTTASHSATVELPDGAYTVKYNAHDLAGNVSQTGEFAFTIDATKPKATVKDGPEFTVATGSSYDKVSFKLFDTGLIDRVELNGVVKDLSNNAWSDVNFVTPGVFGAKSGENTLVVYDVAGNTETVTFTLN